MACLVAVCAIGGVWRAVHLFQTRCLGRMLVVDRACVAVFSGARGMQGQPYLEPTQMHPHLDVSTTLPARKKPRPGLPYSLPLDCF